MLFSLAAPVSSLLAIVLVVALLAPSVIAASSADREHLVVACVGAALASYMAAVVMFLWIRASFGSRVVEGERMPELRLDRALSMALYATCLASLLAPPLGLLILFGTLRPDQDALDWAGAAPLAVVGCGMLAMIAFCATRLIAIVRSK